MLLYYSTVTGKTYETEEAFNEAEKEVAEKKAAEEAARAEAEAKKEALSKERGERAKVVENAINELCELRKETYEKISEKEHSVNELIDAFIKDYGSFHYSYRSGEDMPTISVSKYTRPYRSIFNEFFKNL